MPQVPLVKEHCLVGSRKCAFSVYVSCHPPTTDSFSSKCTSFAKGSEDLTLPSSNIHWMLMEFCVMCVRYADNVTVFPWGLFLFTAQSSASLRHISKCIILTVYILLKDMCMCPCVRVCVWLNSELDLDELGLIKFSVTFFKSYVLREFKLNSSPINTWFVLPNKPRCSLGFSV